MLIAIVLVAVVAAFVGGVLFDWYVPFPRMLLHDKGHRVLLVANEKVLEVVLEVIRKYGGLTPIMQIDSGGTHQTLLSDGATVIMWVDEGVNITHGGFTFVNNNFRERLYATHELCDKLKLLGYGDARNRQPDKSLPSNTLVLTSSPTAFPGGDIGFRPDTRGMMAIAPKAARKL